MGIAFRQPDIRIEDIKSAIGADDARFEEICSKTAGLLFGENKSNPKNVADMKLTGKVSHNLSGAQTKSMAERSATILSVLTSDELEALSDNKPETMTAMLIVAGSEINNMGVDLPKNLSMKLSPSQVSGLPSFMSDVSAHIYRNKLVFDYTDKTGQRQTDKTVTMILGDNKDMSAKDAESVASLYHTLSRPVAQHISDSNALADFNKTLTNTLAAKGVKEQIHYDSPQTRNHVTAIGYESHQASISVNGREVFTKYGLVSVESNYNHDYARNYVEIATKALKGRAIKNEDFVILGKVKKLEAALNADTPDNQTIYGNDEVIAKTLRVNKYGYFVSVDITFADLSKKMSAEHIGEFMSVEPIKQAIENMPSDAVKDCALYKSIVECDSPTAQLPKQITCVMQQPKSKSSEDYSKTFKNDFGVDVVDDKIIEENTYVEEHELTIELPDSASDLEKFKALDDIYSRSFRLKPLSYESDMPSIDTDLLKDDKQAPEDTDQLQ